MHGGSIICLGEVHGMISLRKTENTPYEESPKALIKIDQHASTILLFKNKKPLIPFSSKIKHDGNFYKLPRFKRKYTAVAIKTLTVTGQ